MKKSQLPSSPIVETRDEKTDDNLQLTEETNGVSNSKLIEEIELVEEESVWGKESFLSKIDDLGMGDDEDALARLWADSDDEMHARMQQVLTGPLCVSETGYLLEALDPRHRYGLGHSFRTWEVSGGDKGYFAWLDDMEKYNCGISDFPGKKDEVDYLDDEQRNDYLLDVSSGLTWKATGEPADGKLIFVLSTDGQFYAGSKVRDSENGKKFHHTSFLGGLPVQTAGTLVVSSGTLVAIDGHSGHYQPSVGEVRVGLVQLKQAGLKLDGVMVKPKPNDETKIDAEKFLKENEN